MKGTKLTKILQSVLAVLLIVMTIGAGYLAMMTVEHFDRKVSAEAYRLPGRQALWHGDLAPDKALEKMIAKSRAAGERDAEERYMEALETFRKTGSLSFRMLPVSSFLAWCTLGTALLALALLVLSRHARHDALQTIIGVFAGLMAWITVEHGLIMASRHLGIARRFDLVNGDLIGIRGEFVLLKYSWVFLLLVILYLLFQESVRCNVFVFLRRRLHLMRGPAASGRIDNYAPRVAFFYTSSIWTFYVILLLAFDESIFGAESWFTYSFFFICLTSTAYLFYRLVHQGSFGAILRYAIGVALILWSVVEVLVKWGMLNGPWLSYRPLAVVVCSAGLFISVLIAVREIKRHSQGI